MNTTPISKADMLLKLRKDVEAAAARAHEGGIDAREVATTLEAQTAYYRQRDTMFRAVIPRPEAQIPLN